MIAAKKDSSHIRDEILTILPQLLREEPEVITAIEGIIARQFPRRDEFARLLNEIKLQREETSRQLEQTNRRIDLLGEEMNRRLEQAERSFEQMEQRIGQVEQRVDLLREEMNQRFEQVERRFGQMERHFEQVERRLEQVEQRIEQVEQRVDLLREEMNQRFEQVERRFEQMEQRIEQVEQRIEQVEQRVDLLREEMNRRFEQVDQRFEQVDQRFEQVDQRFEQVDQRFEQVHQDHLELKRRVIKLESGQERILEKMTGFDAWLKVITGNMGTEKGQTLEDLFAIALRYGLKNPNIKPESIRLRQELMDVEGQVFRKYYGTEIDLIAEDGKLTVFELKATASIDDVDLFGMKIELVRLQNPDKQVQGIFVSPGAGERIKKRCMEFGLEFLD